MLTRDEVIWGYRYILGREPESEAVIAQHIASVADWPALRHSMLKLSEFHWLRTAKNLRSQWVVSEILGGRLIWLDLNDKYVSAGCLHNNYAPHGTALIRQYLRPDSVFLDIGANIGWFTLLASTLIGPAGHIHAFEPQRPVVDYLRRSIALNGLEERVTVHGFALDAAPGEGHLGRMPRERNLGHAFLTAASAPGVETHPVSLQTLDSLALDRVDFIKIDVEGAEMRVMSGAQATLTAHRPVIFTELFPKQLRKVSNVSAAEFIAWFTARGYRAVIAESPHDEIHDFPANSGETLIDILLLPRP